MAKDKNKSNDKRGKKKQGFIQSAVGLGLSLYSQREKIAEKVGNVYSSIYGEKKEFDLDELKGQFTALGRLAKAYSKGEYREISPSTFFKIATALAYASWGKDLISDDIPGFGVVDDLAMVSWALGAVIKEIDKFEDWESQHVSEELEVQAV